MQVSCISFTASRVTAVLFISGRSIHSVMSSLISVCSFGAQVIHCKVASRFEATSCLAASTASSQTRMCSERAAAHRYTRPAVTSANVASGVGERCSARRSRRELEGSEWGVATNASSTRDSGSAPFRVRSLESFAHEVMHRYSYQSYESSANNLLEDKEELSRRAYSYTRTSVVTLSCYFLKKETKAE